MSELEMIYILDECVISSVHTDDDDDDDVLLYYVHFSIFTFLSLILNKKYLFCCFIF